ncbi:hypothetical protein PsorP6_019390 [Peronosclerospora sorghi]|nr:hypothetical protein PsorP6_019390 [Peronosclerospora sorghi]
MTKELISHNVYPGLLTSILLVSIPGFAGESEFGYYWTSSRRNLRQIEDRGKSVASETGNLWNLNFQVIYWAYRRLNSGLSEILRMRLRVLHSVTV